MKKTYIAILVASLMTVGGGGGTPKPFHIMATTQTNLVLLVIVIILAMGTPLLSMAIINMGLLVKITM